MRTSSSLARVRAGADGGAEIYPTSMFITPGEVEHHTTMLSRYRADLSLAVAMADYGGPTGGISSGGRSMVCSQTGEILIRLENSGVGIAVATDSPVGWHAKAIMLQSIRCSDRICHWLHNWPSC